MKKFPAVVATPYTPEEIAARSQKPPTKKVKPIKPLNCEMALRQIRAARIFLDAEDITQAEFDVIRSRILARMKEGL